MDKLPKDFLKDLVCMILSLEERGESQDSIYIHVAHDVMGMARKMTGVGGYNVFLPRCSEYSKGKEIKVTNSPD